jgi:predicted ArsR family transcriptional regulator
MAMSVSDTTQARALAGTSRRAILDYLVAAGRAVDVSELTAHVELNHNAIRKHLALLVEAGFVTEDTEERHARGRPRLLYRAAQQQGGTPSPYQRVAVLLARALATGNSPEAIGREAGPNRPTPQNAVAPVEALAESLAHDGFEPAVERRPGRTDIVLRACPFVDAARENPDVVCRLHLGIAEATAAAIGGVSVEALDARDPEREGCRLRVSEGPSALPAARPHAENQRRTREGSDQSHS